MKQRESNGQKIVKKQGFSSHYIEFIAKKMMKITLKLKENLAYAKPQAAHARISKPCVFGKA
ncbi:hypothetical protein [Dehalobacterium formicoaceticum]|uniref:Uncharacterized protein n=1 Tax=Dehalobacterium formicoaceticum TaxID=51515 RepID=A0ABT1Y6D4_9FIRM|nr:hypothetical protein [Dehalobacterium formicoaceticum]MCR6546456.1 hypothetical protein [Dehalobacterium formicoaceticum]